MPEIPMAVRVAVLNAAAQVVILSVEEDQDSTIERLGDRTLELAERFLGWVTEAPEIPVAEPLPSEPDPEILSKAQAAAVATRLGRRVDKEAAAAAMSVEEDRGIKAAPDDLAALVAEGYVEDEEGFLTRPPTQEEAAEGVVDVVAVVVAPSVPEALKLVREQEEREKALGLDLDSEAALNLDAEHEEGFHKERVEGCPSCAVEAAATPPEGFDSVEEYQAEVRRLQEVRRGAKEQAGG